MTQRGLEFEAISLKVIERCPSHFPQYRMVGCSCKEGDTTIQWFWLIAGKDKRCGCGHWFRLKEHAPVDLYDMPA